MVTHDPRLPPPALLLLLLKALILGSVDSFPGTAGLSKEGEGWAIEEATGEGDLVGRNFPLLALQEPLGMWCEEAILGLERVRCGMDPPRSLPHTLKPSERSSLCNYNRLPHHILNYHYPPWTSSCVNSFEPEEL